MGLYIIYVMLSVLFLASAIGLWRLEQLTRPYLFLLIQLITALIVEIAGRFLVRNNTELYNVYILQEVTWIYLAGRLWLDGRLLKSVFGLGLLICIGIWCINMYSIRGHAAFANKAFLSNCILITGLYTAIMLQTASRSKYILRHPLFWLCLAHILYFGCVIPYFSMFNYFTYENEKLGNRLYIINNIIAIIRYTLISYVLWQQGRWSESSEVRQPDLLKVKERSPR